MHLKPFEAFQSEQALFKAFSKPSKKKKLWVASTISHFFFYFFFVAKSTGKALINTLTFAHFHSTPLTSKSSSLSSNEKKKTFPQISIPTFFALCLLLPTRKINGHFCVYLECHCAVKFLKKKSRAKLDSVMISQRFFLFYTDKLIFFCLPQLHLFISLHSLYVHILLRQIFNFKF